MWDHRNVKLIANPESLLCCCSIDGCMSSVTLHMDDLGRRTMANWQWMAASYLLLLERMMRQAALLGDRRPAMQDQIAEKPNAPTSRMHWPPHSTPLRSIPIPIVGEYSDGRTRRRPVRSRSRPGLARRRRLTATRSIRMCAAGRP
jgi:hypothetical protein